MPPASDQKPSWWVDGAIPANPAKATPSAPLLQSLRDVGAEEGSGELYSSPSGPNPMGLANLALRDTGIQVAPPRSGVKLPVPGIVNRVITAAANALPVASAEERMRNFDSMATRDANGKITGLNPDSPMFNAGFGTFANGGPLGSIAERIGGGDVAGGLGELGGTAAVQAIRIPEGLSTRLATFQDQLPHVDRHAAAVADIVGERGGATYSLHEGDRTGQNQYAVAMMPERDREMPITTKPGTPEFKQEVSQHVQNFMNDNADVFGQDRRANVGVWNAPNGKLMLEISGTTHDLPSALDAAAKHNQHAVYDLKNGQDILTGGTGGVLDAPPVDEDLRTAANDYNAQRGAPPISGSYLKPDTRAPQIADAYDAMPHNPNDIAVGRSYAAFKHDIASQWDYATQKLGYKLEPWTGEGQPYANSKEMMADVQNNKHLYYFQGGDMPADHPLAAVDPHTGESYNNMFRAIHDLFGHAQNGFEFSPRGEENAWFTHKQMMSPDAVPAMTTETRGQNSWVNFGEHLRDENGEVPAKGQPGYVAPGARPFAEQKAGLLPPEFNGRDERSRFNDITPSPEKSMTDLRHYSETPVKDGVLSGARRGVGANNNPMRNVGQEAARLSLGRGAPGGVYFYKDGERGEPQIVSRPNEYKLSKMASIADISNNDVWKNAQQQAQQALKAKGLSDTEAFLTSINEAEHAVQGAGYDGYSNSQSSHPGITFMFGDHPLPEKPKPGAGRPFVVQPSFAADLAQKQAAAQGDPARASVEAGGGVYGGKYGFASQGLPEHLVITDPQTGSTVSALESGVTPQIVRTAMATHQLANFPETLLRPQEKIGPRSQKAFRESVSKLPPMADLSELIKAGAKGADWYSASEPIYEALGKHSPTYFPPQYAKHWANVIGALDPHQSVEKNFAEALNVWHAFQTKIVQQGRPVNVSNIRKYAVPAIESLKGTKEGNLVSALLGSSMFEGRNEYLKSPNMGAAVGGDRQAFVGDTHEADIAGVEPTKVFKNTAQVYHAMTAQHRAIARSFDLDTRDVQAAGWSAKMALDVLRKEHPTATALELANMLTPDVVARARKSFVDIMRTDTLVQQRLKRAGVQNVTALVQQIETAAAQRPDAGRAERILQANPVDRNRLGNQIQRIIDAEQRRSTASEAPPAIVRKVSKR